MSWRRTRASLGHCTPASSFLSVEGKGQLSHWRAVVSGRGNQHLPQCLHFSLFVSQNEEQKNSSVQPIWSVIKLNLLLLLLPGASRLIVAVEFSFNSEDRNITSTFLPPWLCNSLSLPESRPTKWACSKATSFLGQQTAWCMYKH